MNGTAHDAVQALRVWRRLDYLTPPVVPLSSGMPQLTACSR